MQTRRQQRYRVGMLRPFDPVCDRHLVAVFYDHAADYVTLETGHPPTPETVDDFFDDRPPSVEPENALHFGAFQDNHLVGIIGLVFGYPKPADCYIGLLLLSPGARGMGIGPRILEQATRLSRARGSRRQLVAVLDANPRGRAFWKREGFVLEKTFEAADDGHVRHRLIRAI